MVALASRPRRSAGCWGDLSVSWDRGGTCHVMGSGTAESGIISWAKAKQLHTVGPWVRRQRVMECHIGWSVAAGFLYGFGLGKKMDALIARGVSGIECHVT